MKLTEEERIFIARRAAGEYAIIPRIRRIVNEHKRNRDPEDAIFLQFGAMVLQKSWKLEDYIRLQKAILKAIPYPYGKQVYHSDSANVAEVSATTPTKRRRKCGLCGGTGHNARTCPSKPNTPTMTLDDGIERLTPGYDPNPPTRVDEGKETT